LALTQCNQIKDQLEKITGDKFVLEVIKTQGDLITNVPLWQLDGKDFFTKELDEALLSGKVDLVVHSYKDLGSIRPDGIQLAAVTKRTYAHDILLIKKEILPTLKDRKEFCVGTSSPRRIVNLEKELHHFLPKAQHLKVSAKVLRGNVNTRIQKLRDNEYDAIVLALPGIERLALTESSCVELTRLLDGMTFMILPQSVFPSSASQGALGIECATNRKDKDDNDGLLAKLQKMQDSDTKEEVQRERKSFNEYGGGCHLAVGVNVKKLGDLYLHTHKGILEGEKVISVSLLEGRTLPTLPKNPKVFVGLPHLDDQLIEKKSVMQNLDQKDHYFISSKYSIPSLNPEKAYGSLYAAGIKTMKEMSRLGFWVNATSDSLGIEESVKLFESKAVKLMLNDSTRFINLTNSESQNGSLPTLTTYERIIKNTDSDFEKKIANTDVFYWTSFFQYQTYLAKFPSIEKKIHACGLGHTYKQFQKNNITAVPFYKMDEFKEWTSK
jgi:hydroxymethylbilane synthase